MQPSPATDGQVELIEAAAPIADDDVAPAAVVEVGHEPDGAPVVRVRATARTPHGYGALSSSIASRTSGRSASPPPADHAVPTAPAKDQVSRSAKVSGTHRAARVSQFLLIR